MSFLIYNSFTIVSLYIRIFHTKNAPRLGADQTVTVTEGRLTRDGGTGICRFEATVTFTFTSEG